MGADERDIMNNQELSVLYDKIYSSINVKGGMYGDTHRRDSLFYEFIKILPKSSIIDVGCGRGHLLRWLKALGHDVRGTEIADCLLKDDLLGLPVKKLFCSELHTIPDNSYDVVISNDVIEHLPDEQQVEQAVKDLSRISKKYVLISTGGRRAATSGVEGVGNVHLVIRPQEWWVGLANKYYKVNQIMDLAGSLFMFGEK